VFAKTTKSFDLPLEIKKLNTKDLAKGTLERTGPPPALLAEPKPL